MYAYIWHNEERIEVWCVGHFTMERVGYYAGTGEIENFQVYCGNENITKELDKDELSDLETMYLARCLRECA